MIFKQNYLIECHLNLDVATCSSCTFNMCELGNFELKESSIDPPPLSLSIYVYIYIYI